MKLWSVAKLEEVWRSGVTEVTLPRGVYLSPAAYRTCLSRGWKVTYPSVDGPRPPGERWTVFFVPLDL